MQIRVPANILSSYNGSTFIHIFFSSGGRKHKICFSRNLELTRKSVLHFLLLKLFVYLATEISLLFALLCNAYTQCCVVNLHSVSLSEMIQMF